MIIKYKINDNESDSDIFQVFKLAINQSRRVHSRDGTKVIHNCFINMILRSTLFLIPSLLNKEAVDLQLS